MSGPPPYSSSDYYGGPSAPRMSHAANDYDPRSGFGAFSFSDTP